MSAITYFVAFGVFAWLVFSLRSRKAIAATLAVAIIVGALAFPPESEAQGGILGVAQQIVSLINGVIGNALTAVNTARSAINSYRQLTLFPQNLLNAARSQIVGMIRQDRQVMGNIFTLNLSSASLPMPQNLETQMRGRQISAIGGISQMFVGAFGAAPALSDAKPASRALSDVDDALAQDSLKSAVASDSATDLELQQADSIEDAASRSNIGHILRWNRLFFYCIRRIEYVGGKCRQRRRHEAARERWR
ncbi:MAG TPA: hypothetical protein VKZ53_28365 [Candidatus Angelobacter sp.]|nr:hypothetical protein [Candidatus Angelobacter sp.]